jgi:hypothetical protein
MLVTMVSAVKTTTAGTAAPMHSMAGDAYDCSGPAVMRRRTAADGAPLIDGARGRIGVRLRFALTAWRRFLR